MRSLVRENMLDISVGGGLENADELTLFRALEGRVGMG